MPKIKVHPTFIAFVCLLFFTGKAAAAVLSFAAVLLHETAHFAAMKHRGYGANSLTLLPYGAMLDATDDVDQTSMVYIAAAGPSANFLLCMLTISFWWIFPQTYAFTRSFYQANLTIGLFNLLPCYPLDGSKIVLGLSKRPHRALKRLKAGGFAVSAVLIALFAITALKKSPNFTFLVMGLFLIVGAVAGKKETAGIMLRSNPLLKDYLRGVKHETYHISAQTTLSDALKLTGKTKYVKYFVYNNNQKFCISEEKLFSVVCRHAPSETILQVISSEQIAQRL